MLVVLFPRKICSATPLHKEHKDMFFCEIIFTMDQIQLLIIRIPLRTNSFFHCFLTSGLFHPYHLDGSIFNFRGFW